MWVAGRAAFVTDPAPRQQLALQQVLADLNDSDRADGRLIIGVKEPRAVRGVSVDGVSLPCSAAVVARGPFSWNLLVRLAAHPNVDYLEPNYTNGDARRAAAVPPRPPQPPP